jgi:hypothetical protein
MIGTMTSQIKNSVEWGTWTLSDVLAPLRNLCRTTVPHALALALSQCKAASTHVETLLTIGETGLWPITAVPGSLVGSVCFVE